MNTQYGIRYRLEDSGVFNAYNRDMIVEPTKSTPFVKYSENEGVFMVKGNSFQPDMHLFYEPLLSRIKAHVEKGQDLDIVLFFNLINSSTAKVLFDLFKFIRLHQGGKSKMSIAWCSEVNNHEMHETGEDFAEIYDLNFKFFSL